MLCGHLFAFLFIFCLNNHFKDKIIKGIYILNIIVPIAYVCFFFSSSCNMLILLSTVPSCLGATDENRVSELPLCTPGDLHFHFISLLVEVILSKRLFENR